jgi:hypothetical protein
MQERAGNSFRQTLRKTHSILCIYIWIFWNEWYNVLRIRYNQDIKNKIKIEIDNNSNAFYTFCDIPSLKKNPVFNYFFVNVLTIICINRDYYYMIKLSLIFLFIYTFSMPYRERASLQVKFIFRIDSKTT